MGDVMPKCRKATAREREAVARAVADKDDVWYARMLYLFNALPFDQRHRWGGDVDEFIKGIDVARGWAT